MTIFIKPADIDASDIVQLLKLHIGDAKQQGVTHTLDINALRHPDIHLICARNDNDALMGVVALKILDAEHGEIKSMRTHPDHLRKGVAARLIRHLIDVAKAQDLKRLYLETHPTARYAAAVKFYVNQGFGYCGPFGDYNDTPHSLFMTLTLDTDKTYKSE